METSSRNPILSALQRAESRRVASRPAVPPLRELSMDRNTLLETFCENLRGQTGIVHRLEGGTDVHETLYEVCREHGIQTAGCTCDEILAPLDLPAWGQTRGLTITAQSEFADRNSLKDFLFTTAEAGITGADYGIAESGTLALAHKPDQARLMSLAPYIHIAVLPAERVVATYEQVVDGLYAAGKAPSQLSFITGPSMTADIQGQPFKGMHGPQKLIVLIV